ncbi:protein crossbronx homolog [Orbicella faveolata]|uniref:protein crossbronx homolog n=1 Tax=Orbicella faveolata TaxID=48498 RepID=UPI0009E1D09B|nr:protein crossbronx homolog [Orbicella faveolata]
MPSISPVHSRSVEDEEERGDQIHKMVSLRKSRSPGSTLSERLKAARKLIPSYPGRAKLVRSVSESSGLTLTTNDERIRSKAETESCATIQDFRTFFREHAIIMEFKHLGQNPVGGVYVMPSLKSLQVWHGIIFVRVGPYRHGIFRFVVILEDDFPQSRPLLKFTTAVFHPQVHPANGVLNLDSHFPLWQRGKNNIW